MLQNVRIINVVLDRVCYRIVSHKGIVIEYRPPPPLYPLLLDLAQDFIAMFHFLVELAHLHLGLAVAVLVLARPNGPRLLLLLHFLHHLLFFFLIQLHHQSGPHVLPLMSLVG